MEYIKKNKIVFLALTLIFFTSQSTLSQHTSKDNYRGNWENPSTWNPNWVNPETNLDEIDITINGYVTVNGDLRFEEGKLTVKDTLVIKGNLTLGEDCELFIHNSGILIVWGNLNIGEEAEISAKGYFIIVKNINKSHSYNEGSLTSNNSPSLVFAGGNVPSGLTNGNSRYPALDCTKDEKYFYSQCHYGNLSDLSQTPVFDFYRSTCSVVKPTVSTSGPLSFCSPNNVTLTSGSGNSYLWSNGLKTQSITVNTSGSYSVQVTDNNLCNSVSSEIVVNAKPLPAKPLITYVGTPDLCPGEQITLTASGAAGYLWSTGSTSQNITVNSSGTYKVKVTGPNGCGSEYSDPVTVTMKPAPLKPSITASGSLAICWDDSVELTSTVSFGYIWSSGATSGSIRVKEPGTYSLRVKNEEGCQSLTSDTKVVSILPKPQKPAITFAGQLSLCPGDSTYLSSSEANKYIWSTGSDKKVISVKNSGEYKVMVMDENGCKSQVSNAVNINLHPFPSKPVITASGPLNICAGDSITLVSSNGAEYIWSTGQKTPSIVTKLAGNYSLRIKTANGCLSEPSEPLNLVVNALPSVAISCKGPVCVNSDTEIKGTPAGGTFKVIDGSATIQDNLLKPSAPGNLIVMYTYTGACTNSTKESIAVTDIPKTQAGKDREISLGKEIYMEAELLPSEKGQWALISGKGTIHDINSPASKITGLAEGKNVFGWKVTKDGCYAVTEVVINVKGFFIPSVITPNGDGNNDVFYIDPEYGKCKLLVFNKWGNLEYSDNEYLNNWEGKNTKGVDLPGDTYFYVLHFANGTVLKGSLLIKKQ